MTRILDLIRLAVDLVEAFNYIRTQQRATPK